MLKATWEKPKQNGEGLLGWVPTGWFWGCLAPGLWLGSQHLSCSSINTSCPTRAQGVLVMCMPCVMAQANILALLSSVVQSHITWHHTNFLLVYWPLKKGRQNTPKIPHYITLSLSRMYTTWRAVSYKQSCLGEKTSIWCFWRWGEEGLASQIGGKTHSSRLYLLSKPRIYLRTV